MSRLIVKNIGKTTTEKQLRDLFGSKGEVTDVRILKTKSGNSRQFAFIGYRNQEQCQEAQKYFDKTYIQTSKMSVEIAKSINDPTLSCAKSRHTQKKLAKEKALERKRIEEERLAQKKESQRAAAARTKPMDKSKLEFLEVMKTRSKAHLWGNDDTAVLQAVHQDDAHETSHSDTDSDEEDINDIVGSDNDSDTDESPPSQAPPGDDKSTGGRDMSDMDYLRAKMTGKVSEMSDSEVDDNGSDMESDLEGSQDEVRHSSKKKRGGGRRATSPDRDPDGVECTEEGSGMIIPSEDQGMAADSDLDDGRLFVRNLPFGCSEEELTELFVCHGPVVQVGMQ